jgi:flagellar biosynthesis protein FliR
MLTDAALAVLGRVQTQIQLVSLTIPVKLAVSMLLLSATLTFQPRVFGSVMTQGIRLIEGMLRSGQ